MVAEERASDLSDARMGLTIGHLPQRRRSFLVYAGLLREDGVGVVDRHAFRAGHQPTQRDRVELVA